jgi:PAS domain S-box-containing protein
MRMGDTAPVGDTDWDAAAFARRARVGTWAVVASNLLFVLTDVRLSGWLWTQVIGLKLLQLAAAFGAIVFLRRQHSRGALLALVYGFAAVVCGVVSISGWLTGDLGTTVILCIAFAWGGATLLPWGPREQAGLTLIVVLAIVLNAVLVTHSFALVFSYSAVAVCVALAISIVLSFEFARQRRALAIADTERHAARDALEQRVRDRTAALEQANARLQESAVAQHESQERFRKISELTSDYSYCFRVAPDLTATIEWVTSASFTRITGYTPAELDARGGVPALLHPDDLPIVLARYERLAAGRDDVSEFRIVRKDGAVRWLREHGYGEWDAQAGRVSRIFGAVQDITEAREVEHALKAQEQFVSAVLDTAGTLIAVLDADGRMVQFNRACETTLGYTFAEVRGRPFWELSPNPDERDVGRRAFAALRDGSGPQTIEAPWHTRTGAVRWLGWSTTFLRAEDGSIRFVIATGIDVTERRAAQRALVRREEHWRALIEHASDLIGILGPEMQVQYISPSIRALLGFSPEEWRNRPAFELIHPDDIAAVAEALAAGLEHRDTGEPLRFRVRHADGSWRMFEGTDTNLLDNEAVRGIVVNLRDITDACVAEDALRRSEAQYRLLFESNPCPLAVFDRDTLRFVSVNTAAVRTYGYSREEFLAMSVTDIRPADDARPELRPEELGSPESLTGLWRHRTKSGRVIEVDVTTAEILFGDRPAVLLQANDVTDRRAAEREVQRLNTNLERLVHERTEQLRATNEELETFSYSVSHDLQVPLRHLKGFARILVEDHGPSLGVEGQRCVDRLTVATARMERLIAGLLIMSRVTSAEFHRHRVHLSRIANDVLAELRAAEPERRVECEVRPDIVTEGDPDLLRIVLQNLLGNAWKYTSRRDTAHIEFGVDESNGRRVFYVRDDGAGFDDAYAGELFTAFRRLHSTAEFEGSGIGLATVKRIVLRHGGSVWAEGAPDRGASMFFTLGEG